MRITPLKTMLKTKIVKDFLSSKNHEEVVKFHGYNSLKYFFLIKYDDFKRKR